MAAPQVHQIERGTAGNHGECSDAKRSPCPLFTQVSAPRGRK